MSQGCFKDVPKVFRGYSKDVTRVFQWCFRHVFKGDSIMFQGCFKDVSMVFQGYVMGVS